MQIQLNSILPNNCQIQDSYSNFQVQPQQKESIDLEKSTEDLIQSRNSVTQSLNRLEAKVSHLVNTINDRNEETPPKTFLTIPDSLTNIDEESHGTVEILTNIQFHHKTLNLTNTNLLTNYQVFILIELKLKMNVTQIPNVVIQFHFLNLC